MSTLIGNCLTCGHDQTRHKGIDPELRLGSMCTGRQIDPVASKELGRSVESGLRCLCDNYVTDTIER